MDNRIPVGLLLQVGFRLQHCFVAQFHQFLRQAAFLALQQLFIYRDKY
jgi:hypothetical protein